MKEKGGGGAPPLEKLRRYTIRRRLFLLNIGIILLSLLLLSYLISVSVERDIAEANNQNLHTLESSSVTLQNTTDSLSTVTMSPILSWPNQSEVYNHLTIMDEGLQDRHPEVNDFNFRNVCQSFSQEMFGLYFSDVRRITILKTDGTGYQSFSSADRPPNLYGNAMTIDLSVSTDAPWFRSLNQARGRMKLFPADWLSDETLFPLRENSLYAGRAIVNSDTFHIIGYIVLRSDISDLKAQVEQALEFPGQAYGFFNSEGSLLFGTLAEEQAAVLLKEADSLSSGEESGSSSQVVFYESSQSRRGIGPTLYNYSQIYGDYFLILETPLFPLVRRTVVRHLPLFLALGAFLVLLAVFFRKISQSVTGPIGRLQRACRYIQAGDYSIVIKDTGSDEITEFTKSFNAMTKEINTLIHEGYEKDLLASRLELQMLRMQINPHFLYNTLESIHAVAYLQGNQEVGQMAILLGRILRYGVTNPSDEVPVRAEAENLNDYVALQKLRYQGSVAFLIMIDEGILDCSIIKVALQPIVENALYHGITSLEQGGMVQVMGYRQEERLVFQIIDNGLGMEEGQVQLLNGYIQGKNKEYHSIGLKNVNRRIQLTYGKEYGVLVQSAPGRGTMVTVTLPAVPYAAGKEEKEEA